VRVVACFRNIDYYDAQVSIDLSRCQTDPRRGIHGIRHVLDKFSDFFIHPGHSGGGFVEPRVRVAQNRQYGHEKLANLTD
jgi:hypothetical protein